MMPLRHLLKLALLPPGANLLLLLAGLLLWPRFPLLGTALILVALALLYLLGCGPVVTYWQHRWSLPTEMASEGSKRQPAAIVILGAGRRHRRSGDSLTRLGVERLHRGAALARSSGLPLLVTGGLTGATALQPTEATLMRDFLVHHFGITPQWQEQQSRTSWENAQLSAPILAAQQVDSIYLVTHGWHLRRARLAFEQAGFTLWSVAAEDRTLDNVALQRWWPSRAAFRLSFLLLHELLGYGWYHYLARRRSAKASVTRAIPNSGQSPKR